MWMYIRYKYHCVQVYVWTSLVCVPMFEAHSTQLYISVCSVHMMVTLVNMCIATSRATTLSVHTVTERPCTCVVCVSHRSAIHMVNKGTEMLHKWTMLSGSYREKANSIGRKPTA